MANYPDRCQHLRINGTQCGSPALRRNRFCFFHKRFQDERIRLAADRKRHGVATFILPVLEDANSIQVGLMQVMRLLLSQQMDHKTASLLLYALQTASTNLRNTRFETNRHDVILDPREVADTPLDSHIWEDEDFEEEDEAEDPVEIEAQRAADAVREKARKEANYKQWLAKDPQYAKPLSDANKVVAKPAQPQPDLKKPLLPTKEEFEADIDALTRKHIFPTMPEEVAKLIDKKAT